MKTIKGSELANKELEVLEDGTLRMLENKGRFIPKKKREDYWYIDTLGESTNIKFIDDEYDKWLIKHSFVFRTEKECLEYKRYLELLDEYTFEPDWVNNECKFYISYNHKFHRLFICPCSAVHESTVKYFASEEIAKIFIEEAGEENVKKFMFNVWE